MGKVVYFFSQITSSKKQYLLLTPIIIAAIIYFPCIKNGWWTVDDPLILNLTIQNGWYKFFYKKEVWHQISSTNLTPWINLSYAIDWFLFGFNPKGFFYHHYLSFLLAIFLCELVIYRTLGLTTALASSLLFIITLPTAMTASFLWLRHYIEGLALSALALLLFLKSYKNLSLYYSVFGAIFYFLACTAKEIYVPLIILIILYPNTFSRKHFRLKISYLFVLFVYILWRYHMLGHNFITGYPSQSFISWTSFFYLIFYNLYLHKVLTFIVIFLFLSLLLFYFSILSNFLKFYFSLIFFSIIFPIVKVSFFLLKIKNNFGYSRILLLFSLFLCLFFSFSLKSSQKRIFTALTFLLLFINAMAFYLNDPIDFANNLYNKYKQLGTFLLSKSDKDVLVYPYEDTYFLNHLLAIYKRILIDKTSFPIICADFCSCKQFFEENSNKEHVNFYLFNGNKIVKKDNFTCNVKNNFHPYAKIKCKNGKIFWEMGPFTKGKYCILMLEQGIPKSKFCLPRKGVMSILFPKEIFLRIVYISPDEWLSYSDIYQLIIKNECQVINLSINSRH